MACRDRWGSELSNDFVCMEHVLDSTKSTVKQRDLEKGRVSEPRYIENVFKSAQQGGI